MADMKSTEGSGPVKSAQRTVELLEYFAANRGQHTLADIQQALGYPKSSLYMLLRTLTECGWVETDRTGTLYGIGVRALLVGTSYIDGDGLVAAARDVLDWLSETTGETIHLARADGSDVVYLATRESKHYLRPISRVGRRLPAHTTSLGKALLAEMPEPSVRKLLGEPLQPLTEHTLTDHDRLAADLAETRLRGYAVDEQENTVGVRCYGVALHVSDPARDALSCSIPIARLSDDSENRIVEALFTARFRLERLTGRR
jgi:DNA-binding IclR family transcriptional regulator